MSDKTQEMLEEVNVKAFLKEYGELRNKYGYDFAPGIQLVKVDKKDIITKK